MKKIDLCLNVMNSLQELFYKDGDNKMYFIDESKYSVYKYYFNENFKAIYGKTIFDEDEVELIRIKDGVTINSVITDTLTIKCIPNGKLLAIIGLIDNEIIFNISNYNKVISNRLIIPSKEVFYKYDGNIDEFSLNHSENKEIDADYYYSDMVSLRSLNTKFKDKELFELIRMNQNEKSNSILQAIVDNLSKGNYVSINTGEKISDISLYSDEIFNKLKKLIEKKETKSLKRN